jgi:oligosaccharide translocation protein RFT1
VNISYLPILIGVPFVYLLGRTYLHATSGSLLDGQFFAEGVMITGISVVIELASEPAFAVIQQRMLFRRRAAIETVSAFVKGILSCAVALFLASRNITPGVLPFAIGQLGFALTLLIRYNTSAHRVATEAGFSLLPRSLHDE